VREERLEISQPALDRRSQIHHQLTARAARSGGVHRRYYKTSGHGRCYGNNMGPPCAGWVEMMVPVFSRAAWRCAWHMIQNDLIYAWGMDYKLSYCAQGDRSRNVPKLGDGGKATMTAATSALGTADRLAVR
jgi:hypothetical protein